MTTISFAWYGTKKVQDAGSHYDRETQSYTNFDNGWKEKTGFFFSDGSGNTLRLCWNNITHYRVGKKDDSATDWLPLNMDEINALLSNGEEWWKTAEEREYRNGSYFVTRDVYSNHADMLGFERV